MSGVIRAATPGDVEIVCTFNQMLAQETEGKVLDRALLHRGVASFLGDPSKGRYYLAESENQLVGQLAVTYEWSDWRAGYFWWLQSVYVRAEARRRGIFRALLRHLQDEARRTAGVIGIRLYVERDNAAAQAVYRQLGLADTNYLVMEQYPL
jgi:GNAT superfamily N-acetyltransferase